MVDETGSTQTQSYLPDYQEQYLKDLLANIYGTDPETGEVTGIASRSPLEGKLVTDDDGNPVYEMNADGSQKLDFSGNPIQETIGGVARPDIARFTDAQKQAIKLGMEGVGAYQPMMDKGAATVEKGLGIFDEGAAYTRRGADALSGTMNADGTAKSFDPNAYKAYMDPYTQEVIDTQYADINRQADMDRNRIRDGAIGAGAFGGSRGALQQSELTRNTADQQARTGAALRSQGYGAAQSQAQSVFENQMSRGANAAQIFNQLGQGMGTLGGDVRTTGIQQAALGEAAQAAQTRDVNSLFNLGTLEQKQMQNEYDVQRAAQMEEAYEPYQRFNYMSDILRGVPSTQGSISTNTAPSGGFLSNLFGMTNAIQGTQQSTGQGILSGLINPSGA